MFQQNATAKSDKCLTNNRVGQRDPSGQKKRSSEESIIASKNIRREKADIEGDSAMDTW